MASRGHRIHFCRFIGCTSLFARWFEWPHKVCAWQAHRIIGRP